MKSRLLPPFLLLFSLSGCEEDCSAVDCLPETFDFSLVNAQGDNLLDNGTLTPDQINILVPGTPADTLPLSVYEQFTGTFLATPISQHTGTYVLSIDGYAPLDLSFELDVRSGDCCTSATVAEAYLNEKPIAANKAGEWFIVLP